MYKITCKTKRFIYIAIRKRLEDIEFSMSIFPRPWRLSHLRAFNMLPFVCQIRRLYTTENLRDRIIPYSNYNHHIYYSYMKTVMRVDIIQFMQWCIRFLLMLRPSYFCQARELHADHSGLLKIFQKKNRTSNIQAVRCKYIRTCRIWCMGFRPSWCIRHVCVLYVTARVKKCIPARLMQLWINSP